jgi:rhomboid family GlyGly-CTERM serine protease
VSHDADKLGLSTTLLISLLSVIATASLSYPGLASALIADQGAIEQYQLWRWLSGPLVHATWGHLLRDLVLLLFAGIALERELGRRYIYLCLLGMAVPTMATLADPQLQYYFGTSGLTHALLSALILHVLWNSSAAPNSPRWIRGLALLGGLTLLGKVLWEVIAGAPLFPMDLGPGIRQVPMAHASGAAVGALFVVATQVSDSLRGRRSLAHRVT